MKNDLSTAPYWNLGILGKCPKTGQAIVTSTLKVLGETAQHAMRRMKKETEGLQLCILQN